MKNEPRREAVRKASQRLRWFSRHALTPASSWASSLRWFLAVLVLVLVACGTHERPAARRLGVTASASTSEPPVLLDPLGIPQSPIVRGDSVGCLPGGGQVTADGAFAYTLPLDVPPGLGLTPSLALHYSSRGGNGPVGRGWSVAGSSSVITRCDATIATEGWADGPDYDESDSYCLDGKKLVQVKGFEGRSEYRTEDDEMSMILAIDGANGGGPGAFEVRTKDGRIRIYEETYATRVVASRDAEQPAGVVTPLWLLSRERDRSGNEIEYLYEKHGAPVPPYSHEFLIDTIAYGPGSSPRRKIVFEYEDRPDPGISYNAGVRWRSTRRLKKIAMWAPNPGSTQKVWEYTLDYERGILGRSLLSAVQKCGYHGTCLWPKRLHWVHENPLQFADGPVLHASRAVTSLRVFDVNGDGRDDFLRALDVPRPPIPVESDPLPPGPVRIPPEPPDELFLSLSEPGSDVSFRTLRVNPEGSPLEHTNLKHSRPVDADGDGTVELLAYDTKTCSYRLVGWSDEDEAFVATGERISRGLSFSCSREFSGEAPGLELVDLNGDALLDVLVQVEQRIHRSFWNIQMNEGGTFGERIETEVNAGFGRCSAAFGGDLDGDGRGELVVAVDLDCSLAVAIGLDDAGEVTVARAFPLERGGSLAKLADINGDGLSDALWVRGGSVELRVNTGNGFGPAVTLSDPALAEVLEMVTGESGTKVIEPFDLNRDGRDDLLVSISDWFNAWAPEPHYADRIIALLSVGDGTFLREEIGWEEPETGTHYAPIPAGDAMWHGDFNGDGRADVLTLDGGSLVVTLATGADAELLSGVSDGDASRSRRVEVRYGRTDPASSPQASCTYPQRCVRRGVPVVAWVGGLERPGGTQYRFEDLRTDLLGRGSLGFGRMMEWSSAWPVERVTTFDNATRVETTYPFAGRPRTIQEVRPILNHGPLGARDCRAIIDGSCTLEEGPARAKARVVHQEIDYRIVKLHGGRTSFVSTRWMERREYEDPEVEIDWVEAAREHCSGVDDPGDSAPIRQSATYEVDDHGNLRNETIETEGGVRREVTRTFDVRPDEWLVGLVDTQAERVYEAGSTPPAKLHTDYDHDERGLLDEVKIEPDSADADVRETITLTYDEAGRLRQEKREAVGESSRIWNYEYDDVSGEGIFVSQVWNALGVSQWMVTHPAYGVLMGESDANGARSTRIHDDLGRLKTASSGTGAASETSMAAQVEAGRTAGLVVETTLATGGRAVATLDERGLVVEQAERAFDGQMKVRKRSYDVFGRLLSVSRPGFGAAAEEKTEWRYDSLGRVLSETGPDGARQRYEHKLFQTITFDPEGRRSWTILDVEGRPSETAVEVDGVRQATMFAYGPNSKPWTVTDPRGNVTEMGHDLRGRRTSVRDPDAGTRITRYNGYGEIREEVDALGHTTVVERDAMGRRRYVTNAGELTTFTWDTAPHGVGQLASAESPDGTVVSYAYDPRGRVSEVRTTVEGEAFAVGVTYTPDGLRDELLYPKVPGRDRFRVKHVYEDGSLSELRGTQEDGTLRLLWKVSARNADGALLKAMLGNEVIAERTYEPVTGRLETVQARKSGRLQALTYRYYDDGRVRERQDSAASRVETFHYDEVGRLERWHLNAHGTKYGYDELGNLRTVKVDGVLAEENHHDPLGRPHAVTARDGVTFDYDKAGRLEGSSAGLRIRYTAFDLPRWVERGGKRWDFLYDAFGARVKKAQDGEETVTIGGVYERREDASGTRHVFRVASPEGEVAQVVFAGPGDERTLYVHADAQGSVGLVTDDAGEEVERLHYEPFGRRIDAEGKALGASKGEVRHGFTGHRHDDELGLIDMRGRLYDPNLRRFLTPDPFVTDPMWGQSYNRYSYVMNDPVNLVDPTGWIWKRVKSADGGEGWVEFDDTTGALLTPFVEIIDVVAPADAPPSTEGKPPADGWDERGHPEFESDWASFVHAGDEYFEQGGGSSVGDDYSGTGTTLAAVLEHGVRLSDITGEKPMAGIVSGSVMEDPVIVPRFNWSAAVARDFHVALELGTLAWHAGDDVEVLIQDLRAAMDVLALVGAVAVESGVGAAMVLGAVLPKLGGGAAVPEAAARGRTTITSGSQVTEQTIREAMKDAPFASQQARGVSLPMVQRYVDKLIAGEVAPAIKVDGRMIVDGNHRYVAGRVFGQEPAIQPWAGGRPERLVPWENIPVNPEMW
ncbi:FG-GAP-like repeat-containing protein [Sorangium sp. So ce119]|uniref:FG-GAP-like repeat-containing protein n=1 Tax=Sorangium sp. So ce119 TaxID=3133279 RepID=UPI003F606F9F